MKTVQFKIPVIQRQSISVQEDILESFYPFFHRHPEAQLMWIVKGEGMLFVDGHVHPFKPNDIFFIAANQAHVFKSLTDGTKKNESCSISIFFDPVGKLNQLFMLGEFVALKDFFKHNTRGFKIPEKDFELVSNRLLEIKKSDRIDKMMHFFYLLNLLPSICQDTIPLCPEDHSIMDGQAERGDRIVTICHYIDQHFREELTLDGIASRANLSPQAFCRYFKKHSGMTLVGYLNRLRINEVCAHLDRNHLDSISLIAYNCGFKSITNFNRIFKHIVGCTPKEYILSYKQKNMNNFSESYV